jgi:hypothetical protein
VAEILVGRSRAVVHVDDADLPALSRCRWTLYSDARRRTRYAREARNCPCGSAGGRRMHNVIMGSNDPVDHRDGDGLNNRRANLRHCTGAQNQANTWKRRNGASRFKGVFPSPSGKWKAGIRIDGRLRHLGTFVSDEDAARAYDRAARAAWGDWAALNFPGPGERSALSGRPNGAAATTPGSAA